MISVRVAIAIAFTGLATQPIATTVAASTSDVQDYAVAIESGLFAEAEALAKQRLEAEIRAGNRDDVAIASVYVDLANAQRLQLSLDAALQNYQIAIDIVESGRDRLDSDLVAPLTGMALTYLQMGDAESAEQSVTRAVHIGHVNDGPHNFQQLDALELLFESQWMAGRTEALESTAYRMRSLLERQIDAGSPSALDLVTRVAGLYARIGDRRAERSVYRRLLDASARFDGQELQAAAEVRAKSGLGTSYLIEYFDDLYSAVDGRDPADARMLARSKRFLGEAVDQGQALSAAQARVASDARLAMGDYSTLTGDSGQARLMYADAWALLTESGYTGLRDERLSRVNPLIQLLPELAGTDAGDVEVLRTGYVLLQFTVTRRGDVRDVEVLSADPQPDEVFRSQLVTAVRRFAYRPRFQGGFAVDTPQVEFRYEYPVIDAGDP